MPALCTNVVPVAPPGHVSEIVHCAQELRVYENGKQTATNTPMNGSAVWTLTVPVMNGSRYILAQQADLGDPYGGYRGQPGLRCSSLTCETTVLYVQDELLRFEAKILQRSVCCHLALEDQA